jgi:hypothetical protein
MNFLLKQNLTLSASIVPTVDFTGTWKNQMGSKMIIQVLTNGQIKGVYITAVGAPDNFEEFDLIGTATGDLISFIVDFGKYGSLTAWNGQHTIENSKGKIATLWHLAKNVRDEDEEANLWGAIWTGADNFHKI